MSVEQRTARAVVVGGGLAGLAAAVRLAEQGIAVTLLEARPRLGGATSSFERGELTVDTGQHVLLRCYDQYLDFLGRVGASDGVRLQGAFDVPVLKKRSLPDGTHQLLRARLRRNRLPAPLHLAGALGRYRLLRPTERASAVAAALRLRFMDPDDPRLDELSFGDWLAKHGQRQPAIDALWGMFTVAALNTDVHSASLGLAVKVFRTGLLTRNDWSDIGVPRVPLAQLHGEPAARRLRELGADVRTQAKVTGLAKAGAGAGLTVSTADGEHDADVVVLAVPHQDAARLLPADAVHGGQQRLDAIAGLGNEPIMNVHVHYDRPVGRDEFVSVVGSPVQWVFDRTRVAGAGNGQYLAVSLSAAAERIDAPVDTLRQEFLPELARLFPAARDAEVLDFFVTRERRATFRQAPGSRKLRPAAETALPGLLLAGAWTATGWPDTMEGAVRSGYEAARLAARGLGTARLIGKVHT
jgi:squalene-associated FAD-dependent desaturase